MAAPTNTASMDLCSTAFAEQWIDMTDDTLAPILPSAIDRASVMIENYCDRRFKYETQTDALYDGEGSFELYLREWPVDSVSAVGFWQTGATFSTEVVTTDRLNVEDIYNNGRIFWIDGNSFPAGHSNIKITHVSGYATTPANLPIDLQGACVELVQALLRRRESDSHLFDAISNVDGQSMTFKAEDIPRSVRRVLDSKYRKPIIGAGAL